MDAYTAALTLLSRRELSAKQLRDRLLRRKFTAEDVAAVLERLTNDRTLDDQRVAVASARMEAAIKGRGRRRVLQHVQQLGVSADVAAAAVDEVFADVDESALLDRAMEKRLRGAAPRDLDTKAKARLVRQLVAHGFAPSTVLAHLRRKRLDPDE